MTYDTGWREDLKDLVQLREGAMHVAQYIAVMAGIRRSMDDWIPAPRFDTFQKLTSRLGLAIEVDCVFSPVREEQSPFGKEYAPTTSALGQPFSFAEPDQFQLQDEVHVTIAKTREQAQETLECVWYPVVIDNRVIHKPSVDVYKLGAAFGYPECCVKFFMQHNDWPRQNTMAEAYKVSRHLSWKTNCLAKNTEKMLIFHMPCAFDCPRTMAYSSALIEEIKDFDSTFAHSVENFLRQTVLVASERVAFVLRNATPSANGRTRYQGVESLRGFFRVPDALIEPCYQALAGSTEVAIADGTIFVWNGDSVRAIETACDCGVAEVPLLLDFSRGD